MTLARQVDLEEGGSNAGANSGHHAPREDHPTSEAQDQQHHTASGGSHQQLYNTILTPTRYISRQDMYGHKVEIDDPDYEPGITTVHYFLKRYMPFYLIEKPFSKT